MAPLVALSSTISLRTFGNYVATNTSQWLLMFTKCCHSTGRSYEWFCYEFMVQTETAEITLVGIF